MMDAQIKKLWVDALRSGKYKQGSGALYNCGYNGGVPDEQVKGHCCLGVLMDVVFREVIGVDLENYARPGSGVRAVYNTPFGSGSTAIPPRPFLGFVGLPSLQCIYLAGMNDIGKSFAAIANYIERNL